MHKKVGPIEPPRMLATILPPNTEVQGLGDDVELFGAGLQRSCTTAEELLHDCGHPHNVLCYPVQELRNTLSMAGYRYWKAGSERIDCIYLPSHVDIRADGETMSYGIRGCNSELSLLFYARTGEVPESLRSITTLSAADQLLANMQAQREEEDEQPSQPQPRKKKRVAPKAVHRGFSDEEEIDKEVARAGGGPGGAGEGQKKRVRKKLAKPAGSSQAQDCGVRNQGEDGPNGPARAVVGNFGGEDDDGWVTVER